jgi:hypothetical protein
MQHCYCSVRKYRLPGSYIRCSTATLRYENVDCLDPTYDAALLLFGTKISTAWILHRMQHCYCSVRKYRLPGSYIRCSTATVWYENIDCLYPTYDAALLLFDMKISTACILHTMQHCYYSLWKYRLSVSYIRCSTATIRYENIDCLYPTYDAALLLFDMKISTACILHTMQHCYCSLWKYRLPVSYVRYNTTTVRYANIDSIWPTYDAAY